MKTLNKEIPVENNVIVKAPDDAQYVMVNSYHSPIFFKKDEQDQWWVRVVDEGYWRKSCSGAYWFKNDKLIKVDNDSD